MTPSAFETGAVSPENTEAPMPADDTVAALQFTPLLALDVAANDAGHGEITALSGETEGLNVATLGGRVALNADGTLAYTPRRDFTGEDSFTYTVTGAGVSETATVTIDVAPMDADLEAARLVGYLYEAGLGRFPQRAGLEFWTGRLVDDIRTEAEVARAFLISDEFTDTVGGFVDTLTDREIVEELFLNVLDRPGVEAGIEFWVDQLADPGFDRSDLLIEFAESPENQLGSPRAADIRERAEGSYDFGLVLGTSDDPVAEGSATTLTLTAAQDFPDGETFTVALSGAEGDGTANPAEPEGDLALSGTEFAFPPGTVSGDSVTLDLSAIDDGTVEGRELYRVQVRDADGLILDDITGAIKDGTAGEPTATRIDAPGEYAATEGPDTFVFPVAVEGAGDGENLVGAEFEGEARIAGFDDRFDTLVFEATGGASLVLDEFLEGGRGLVIGSNEIDVELLYFFADSSAFPGDSGTTLVVQGTSFATEDFVEIA